MLEPEFFDIPIYRCKKNTHTTDMEKQKAKMLKSVSKELTPDSYNRLSNHFDRSIWYPWTYNEIIGHLNLYIMGTQFRADYWFVTKKRINKGIIKKRFTYQGKVMEASLPRNKTSEEIFSFILDKLSNLNKTEFTKFTFDLRHFIIIGKFVNWIELTDKLNTFKYAKMREKYFEEIRNSC